MHVQQLVDIFWGSIRSAFPQVNTIDYITIATLGNAADFGDLSTISTGNSADFGKKLGEMLLFIVQEQFLWEEVMEIITILLNMLHLQHLGNYQDFGDLTHLQDNSGGVASFN